MKDVIKAFDAHLAGLSLRFEAAFCDRQIDLDDCIALKPTTDEIQTCLEWVQERDANPDWPEHVERSFDLLRRRLGYAS